MSNFKRAIPGGTTLRTDVLGRLREVQIIDSKPVLPAEILSKVLDNVDATDLIQCAQVSKRMREMVYDDTRWVQKLRLMGCWNEAAARAYGEEARRKKLEALALKHGEELKKARNGSTQAISVATDDAVQRPNIILSQPAGKVTPEGIPTSDEDLERGNHLLTDAFDFIALSPTTPDLPHPTHPPNSLDILDVMSKARSVRGAARQEYGRVHGALTPYYKDAVRSKQPSDAKIFRVYRDPIQQAKMLAQLVQFNKCDVSKGWQTREKRLIFMVAAFEDAVYQEFEQGLKMDDVDGRMKKYAHVLVALNGGQKAVMRFISENPLLKDGNHLGDPMDCVSPSNPDILFLIESQSFFGHLSAAFNVQIGVIDRVFPPSVNVIIPFLQKVETEILNPYLKTLFDYLHEKSQESYVQAISGIYVQSLRFAKSLKAEKHSREGFQEAVGQSITNLFAPYVETYFVEELAFFRRKSEAEVIGWERQLSQADASIESLYMANVNRQADKRDFLSSFKKVIMMPVNVLPSFGGKSVVSRSSATGESLEAQKRSSQDYSRTASPEPHHSRSISLSRAPSPSTQPPTDELAAKAAILKTRLDGIRSLFSLEVALNLVHLAKASLERAANFAKFDSQFKAEARQECETIFILLLQTLGTRHIRAGFDKAVEHLAKYNPRTHTERETQHGVTPLVMFLELVNVGDLIQQMLDVFYEQELVATKLTDRNDFLNPTVKEKKRFEQMLDERVAAGLNKGIEVLMTEVELICATTQNVEDFNPGATGVIINQIIDVSPTNTAIWIVDVVSAHTKMLVGSTDKNMLDVFNQEVGLRLFTTLCKHLKRQRISVAGSIRLISDMNHYFSFIQTLKNKDLLEYFIALRELSQIYLIAPSDAKELAVVIADSDRFHGIFRAEEVYEFAERRADWYQVKSRVEKAMYGIGCTVM